MVCTIEIMTKYEDYLRERLVIKLVIDEKSVINATKDLVYANMEKVIGGEFNYNNYYTGMEISVDSSVNTWFKNDAFGSGGKVDFNKFIYKKRYN